MLFLSENRRGGQSNGYRTTVEANLHRLNILGTVVQGFFALKHGYN